MNVRLLAAASDEQQLIRSSHWWCIAIQHFPTLFQ